MAEHRFPPLVFDVGAFGQKKISPSQKASGLIVVRPKVAVALVVHGAVDDADAEADMHTIRLVRVPDAN